MLIAEMGSFPFSELSLRNQSFGMTESPNGMFLMDRLGMGVREALQPRRAAGQGFF